MTAPSKVRRPIDVLKNLPANIEAEKSFLGSVFLDSGVLDREILTPENFRLESNRRIYTAMLELWEGRIPIDPVILSDLLEKKDWSRHTGGFGYLDELSIIVPTAANASHYARILKEQTALRNAKILNFQHAQAIEEGDLVEVERIEQKMAESEDPDKGEFSLIHPSVAFSKVLPPPVYVLPSLRPRTVGLIVAQEGVGKSFLALEIGLAKATGYDLTGIGITGPGNGVVYFSKEDPPEIIEERLQSLVPFIESDEVLTRTDGLEIVSLYGRRATLASEKSLVNEKLIRQIIKTGSGKDLLIFDTLRKLHDLEENSSGEMKVLLEIFDRIALETGAAVLLIHHTNKSANLNGQQGDQSSARGSNAIVGNTRWSLHLETVKNEAGTKMLKVSIPRASYGPEGGEWWLERTAGGVLVAGPSPSKAEGGEKPKKSSQARTLGLVTLGGGENHYEQD